MVKNKTTIRFLALIAFLLPVLHLAFYFGTQEQLRALFIETMIQWGEFFLKHFNLWVYLWLLEGIALIAIGVNLLRQRKKSTGFFPPDGFSLGGQLPRDYHPSAKQPSRAIHFPRPNHIFYFWYYDLSLGHLSPGLPRFHQKKPPLQGQLPA
jgi:hypothetical protein